MEYHRFWTDSTDVLYWIHGQLRQYKTFVANRVSRIHEFTKPAQWNHVPGQENPADDPTRGLKIDEMNGKHRWFTGPSFLHEGEENWPRKNLQSKSLSQDAEIEQGKQEMLVFGTVTAENMQPIIDVKRISSWLKLKRVVAIILKFVKMLKKEAPRYTGTCRVNLEVEEMEGAGVYLLKCCPMEKYGKEITVLKNGKSLPKSCSLLKLSPFLDTEGLLRVGGRLEHADLAYDARFPIILPKKHHTTKLIVEKTHRNGGHFRGTNAVLAAVREKYWVIDSREEVKRCKVNCLLCRLKNTTGAVQLMAPLPRERLEATMRCFVNCCVDYGGPFTVKITRNTTAKRYLCLFSCMATKAVHLEMAYSLDTAGFLLAFSRMVARRCKPRVMYSDNGGNFTAAEKELKLLVSKLKNGDVAEKLTN